MSLKFWDLKQEEISNKFKACKGWRCYKVQKAAFLKPKVGINQCVLGTSTEHGSQT